jgi:hypothetical protein
MTLDVMNNNTCRTQRDILAVRQVWSSGVFVELPSTTLIMRKHSRADSDIETINLVFERLFDIVNTSKPTNDVILSILKKLKHQALSTAAEEEEFTRKAAKEFTLEEAVQTFGLIYTSSLKQSEKHQWKIEVLPDVTTFQPSACLGKVSP